MARLLLPTPDLALFTDPSNTLVPVPHMIAAPRSRVRSKVLVDFEGDVSPTSFRGVSKRRTYDLTCRYAFNEHAQMGALVALLEHAEDVRDGRLQLRTNFFDVPYLNPFEVVDAGDVTEQHLGGRAWDVTFPVTTVNYEWAQSAFTVPPSLVLTGGGYRGGY